MARNGVLANIGDLLADVGRARRAAATYERLSAMSDAALRARGLERTDLASAALEDAFRK